jgi:hypothetical protein
VAAARHPRLSAPLAAGPAQAVALRLRDGRRRELRLDAVAHRALLAELLHSGRPGLVEVAGARRPPGQRLGGFERSRPENFVAAGDGAAFLARVRALGEGARREVFFTPATLAAAAPGNASVRESAVVWVDIDDPARLATLRAFPHRPHAVIASGSGGAHAYWQLSSPLQGEACDAANRKLAGALGADLASTNRGRIMRVPGTLNHKCAPAAWCRLVMCDMARPGYDAALLTAGLADPKAPVPRRRRVRPRFAAGVEEPWRELAAAEYYRVITGSEPRRDGKIRCPNAAHLDRHPSAHLYSAPGAGWFCFACGAGGGAVDMVAALRGWPTGAALRDEQFRECVAELRRLFGVPEPGAAARGGR